MSASPQSTTNAVDRSSRSEDWSRTVVMAEGTQKGSITRVKKGMASSIRIRPFLGRPPKYNPRYDHAPMKAEEDKTIQRLVGSHTTSMIHCIVVADQPSNSFPKTSNRGWLPRLLQFIANSQLAETCRPAVWRETSVTTRFTTQIREPHAMKRRIANYSRHYTAAMIPCGGLPEWLAAVMNRLPVQLVF